MIVLDNARVESDLFFEISEKKCLRVQGSLKSHTDQFLRGRLWRIKLFSSPFSLILFILSAI